MENRALQFSVYDFHLVKPGLTKHSLLVWMRYKRVTNREIFLLYVFRGKRNSLHTHTHTGNSKEHIGKNERKWQIFYSSCWASFAMGKFSSSVDITYNKGR